MAVAREVDEGRADRRGPESTAGEALLKRQATKRTMPCLSVMRLKLRKIRAVCVEYCSLCIEHTSVQID